MREWGEIGRLCPEKFACSGSFNWICFEESSSKVIPGSLGGHGTPNNGKFPIRASHICDRDSGLGVGLGNSMGNVPFVGGPLLGVPENLPEIFTTGKWLLSTFSRFEWQFEDLGWFLLKVFVTGVVILPTQTLHFYGETHQIYHTFALFDPPKMGNLMTPVLMPSTFGAPLIFRVPSHSEKRQVVCYFLFLFNKSSGLKKYTPEN